jgi:acylphosphatase
MAAAAPDHQRREVHYSGRVQGVGFRYTARQLASEFSVTGFVRNLPDGRVNLVVEGAKAEVDKFLASIAAELGNHIRNTSIDVRPATGEFKDFEIGY